MAGKKILIVDYDTKSIESLSKLFEGYEIEVVTAMDGVEAYEKFKSDEPDLVLLEAMLPRMHGFDLAQKINFDTKGRIPVIIVTAVYKGHQYRNEALRTFGVSDYYEKPYDQDKLVNRVLSLIGERGEVEEDISEIPGLPDPDSVIETL
ncbi:MAG: response regulator, partial [Candidatus Aminicenantes bacterium]|nr:response regulator [Candidatus Aminicenantes bacterium]